MFEELFGKCSLDISKGDVVSIDDKYKINDYDIKNTIFKTIDDLVLYLRNDGFLIESKIIKVNNLRVFDDKNLHVQYDADKIYSIHIKDKDVYERLKIATKEIIPMKSYFISKQTILLNDFEGDKN